MALQAWFEQATSVGALAFHWDRRACVLARDILRLGTATGFSSSEGFAVLA